MSASTIVVALVIRVHAKHAAAALVQVAHHIAGEFVRPPLPSGMRSALSSTGASFHEALLKCLAGCGLECHLGGVYRMVRSIVQHWPSRPLPGKPARGPFRTDS